MWPTPGSYYDTSGNQGTDGMTYADRTPQTDYYQARKVYSNIIIREAPLRVLNRFDFTNLSDIDFGWQLMGDGKELASGKLKVECAPTTPRCCRCRLGFRSRSRQASTG